MTTTIYVTKAERDAALAIIERSARTGKDVPEAVRKIAGANGSPTPAPTVRTIGPAAAGT
jgi:hypothetical protein